MFDVIGPWVADNAMTGVVGVVLFYLNRDLRKHMDEEAKWREKNDDWKTDHLTGHP